MLQFKNESKIVDFDKEEDEWAGVMEKIEDIEKIDEKQFEMQE
jgi:hypothetical protein